MSETVSETEMNMRTVRLTALLLCTAGTAVMLPAVGCDSGSGSKVAQTSEVVPAEVRTFEITTRATGDLEARQRVELRSGLERQATISFIIPEGTRVDAGTVLVKLNSDEIQREIEEEELQVTEARLQLESAEAAYEIQVSDNAAELRKAELAVDLAELALQQWQEGEYQKQMKQLTTAIDRTKRNLDRLDDKVKKSEELFGREFLSKDELEQDRISLLDARAAYETALLDLKVYTEYQMKQDKAQKESDLAEAKNDLVRVEKSNEINLTNKASQRENRSVQLGRREERLRNYQEQLAACTVTAPRSGLVVYGTTTNSNDWRSQQEGALAIGRQIYPNELLIVLPDTTEMVASVKVHESLAGRIRPGQPAQIKIDAAGGIVVPGHVESIGVLAESGGFRDPNRREYTVRVTVEKGDHSASIKPSMRCEAEIVLGTVENSLTVPVQAVFSDGPVRYVYLSEGGRYAKKPVSLGRRSDLYAEITAGLDSGDKVLIREPAPGEVLAGDWSASELQLAGYQVDDNGNPVGSSRGMPGMFTGDRPSGARGGNRGAGQAGGQTGGSSEAGAPRGPRPEGGDKPEAESTETVAQEADAGGQPSTGSESESGVEAAPVAANE